MKKIYENISIDRNTQMNLFKFKATDIDRIIPMHFHNEIELIYCVKGQLKIWHEGKNSIMSKGDLLFINSGMPHLSQSTSKNEVIVIHLPETLFIQEKLYIKLDTVNEDIPERIKKQITNIMTSLYELHCSYGEFSFLKEQSLVLDLEYILVTQLACQLKNEKEFYSNQQKKIKEIIHIVKEHYRDNISLKEVASLCGYSPAYLSRMFHQHVGQSFVEFKQILSLEKAIELMETTDKTFEQISMETGFSNEKSFRKVFKQVIGKTPREYKSSKKTTEIK
ncbi:AraC family transcriptional regulator [Amphibacillus jilinensis]|uniref:AraC family transcriptional regulator n=1 Tax=Amphibacillus jilinensis TaxID=1216008 RepID=UPI0002F1D269|nr:AraC family transcriptional regulator [Amphibacillus jilinensis]